MANTYEQFRTKIYTQFHFVVGVSVVLSVVPIMEMLGYEQPLTFWLWISQGMLSATAGFVYIHQLSIYLTNYQLGFFIGLLSGLYACLMGYYPECSFGKVVLVYVLLYPLHLGLSMRWITKTKESIVARVN